MTGPFTQETFLAALSRHNIAKFAHGEAANASPIPANYGEIEDTAAAARADFESELAGMTGISADQIREALS